VQYQVEAGEPTNVFSGVGSARRSRAQTAKRNGRRGNPPPDGHSVTPSSPTRSERAASTANGRFGCYWPIQRPLARVRLEGLLELDKGSPPFTGGFRATHRRGPGPAVRVGSALWRPLSGPVPFQGHSQPKGEPFAVQALRIILIKSHPLMASAIAIQIPPQ